MKMRSGLMVLFVLLSMAAFVFTGCELEEDGADGTNTGNGNGNTADTTGGGGGGGGDDIGGNTDPCSDFGCASDGICNFQCADNSGNPTDPDCNPNTPQNSNSAKKSASCSCDYWGFVCEASEKCSTQECSCDPDCAAPAGCTDSLACVGDGHCDTWCPTGEDIDCIGSSDDGKYCGGTTSCDIKAGECNAKKGSTAECADDPDCDGFDLACEADGYCDTNCSAGADPDC